MALDQSSPATGSWGLGPLGAPSASTMTPALRSQPQFTPAQIAQMRQEAMALQTPPAQGIHHWTQGLAELVRAIQGNREADFARQTEAAGRQAGAEATAGMVAPLLSPGGSPPAAGPAPAGTLGSGPAGASPSSDSPPAATLPATTTADASAPRGIRNNNPLNIEDGQFARSQPGYAGSDGRFAKFEAPEHGVAAADSLLSSYQTNHGLNTVAGIVSRWAPAGDGNNTKAYATDVAAQLGIGPNDPIPPAMRPQLIAAMAKHENGVPLNVPSAAPSGPTGLLAPIPPPAAAPNQPSAAAPAVMPAVSANPTPPVRLAYAGTGNLPPGMLPPPVTQGGQTPAVPAPPVQPTAPSGPTVGNMAPMVNAIAGRPVPPPDFAQQVAAMQAKNDAAIAVPAVPMSPNAFSGDFAKQAASLLAGNGGAPVPLPAAPDTTASALPPSPVPLPQPRPDIPLPPGSAIPGAVGPTSVGGTPLVPPGTAAASPQLAIPPPFGATSVNGQPLPQSGGNLSPMISAIAGRPVPTPVSATSVGGGAPNLPAPIQVAQNGAPTSAAPSPAGGPAGGLMPLTSPTVQITQQQLTTMLANPWVPDATKAAMLQMIQQRGQVQSTKVPGGTMQIIPGTGQHQFIPEEVSAPIESGSTKVQGRAVYDPNTGRYHVQTLLPDAPAGGATAGQPDLSSIGALQANEVAQAGAKKGAEKAAETDVTQYSNLHKGLAGAGMTAADSLPYIQIAKGAIEDPNFYSGSGSDAILQLKKMGVATGLLPETATTPMEALSKVMASNILQQINGLKAEQEAMGQTGGRIFSSQIELMEKAAQNPGNSVAANRYLTNLAEWSAKRQMAVANMADDYKTTHGRLDANFEKNVRNAIATDPELALPKSLQFPDAEAAKSGSSTPAQSAIEAEMRKRGLLKGPAAPVSQ